MELLVCPKCGKEGSWRRPSDDDGRSSSNEEGEQDSNRNASKEGTKKMSNVAKYLMIGGGVVAAPCALAGAAGFGVAGIAGGSAAAAFQAGVGNIVAGSTFAVLQSMGATGLFYAGAAWGGVATAAGAAVALAKSGGDNCDVNEENEENGPDQQAREDDEGRVWIRCAHCSNPIFV